MGELFLAIIQHLNKRLYNHPLDSAGLSNLGFLVGRIMHCQSNQRDCLWRCQRYLVQSLNQNHSEVGRVALDSLDLQGGDDIVNDERPIS